MKLKCRYVEKPWGCITLPPLFDPPPQTRIGEVWFTDGEELPLLAKYIFTSQRLSIQVHPSEAQAHHRGLPHGKSEFWYIVEAEPTAELGLGLRREVTADELREAALDGSIEQLIDWRPVRAGDFVFVDAGTLHAIGAGVGLIEFQQNSDVTYRLYDYGRGRELHLDDGIAVAQRRPFSGKLRQLAPEQEQVLVDGPHFVLVHTKGDILKEKRRWVLPLEGEVQCEGSSARAGECLLVGAGQTLSCTDARMLIGATA